MGTPDRPNILIFLPHDLGDFLGCYGHRSVSSPHLDRLAAQGISFSNCFTPVPECSPSRGCMMTGLQPHQHGLLGLSNFGWSLTAPHLASQLQEAGYATHLFGLQHESLAPQEELGYQHIHDDHGREAGAVCQDLCDFLRSPAAQDEAPWFACAGFRHVHRVWAHPEHLDPATLEVPSWLPDHPVVRQDLARFHEDIEEMDTAIGEVLATLEESAAKQQTLVIFTTDHGAAFPGAKATLYDPGLRLPLIFHWPGQISGGQRHDCLISNMDVTPTLLELAGAPVPSGLAGRSFLPLLKDEPYTPRDSVHGSLFYDVAYDPMHYVRTSTHKYIRSFAVTPEEAASADPEVLTSFEAGRWVRVDDLDVLTSPTWQALAPPNGSARPPAEELYDLRSDPNERENLVEDPAAADILLDLRERLHQMMVDTQSPLLHGHVPPPDKQREAARVHSPGTPVYHEHVSKRQSLLNEASTRKT